MALYTITKYILIAACLCLIALGVYGEYKTRKNKE